MKQARPTALAERYPNQQADRNFLSDPDSGLEVSREVCFTLSADAVRFGLTVESSTLATTESEVLSLPELGSLIQKCEGSGAGNVSVTHVSTMAKSGILGSSVSGRYGIELSVPIAALAEVTTTIASDKNVTLTSACWSFPRDDTERLTAIREATSLARKEAETMAEACNATLGKTHRALLDISAEDATAAPIRNLSKVSSGETPFFTLSAKRTVRVCATLRFRL